MVREETFKIMAISDLVKIGSTVFFFDILIPF
jgi:hypothetical protein